MALANPAVRWARSRWLAWEADGDRCAGRDAVTPVALAGVRVDEAGSTRWTAGGQGAPPRSPQKKGRQKNAHDPAGGARWGDCAKEGARRAMCRTMPYLRASSVRERSMAAPERSLAR